MTRSSVLPSWIAVKKNPDGWLYNYSVVLYPRPRPLTNRFTTTNVIASQHRTETAARARARELIRKYKTASGVVRDFLGWKK